MANITRTLVDGLKIGDTTHLEVELRMSNVGDTLDAATAAEKVVATPDGYQLVVSPTLTGLEVLRRQIVCIGDHPGPLTLSEIRKLSNADLHILQEASDALELATLKAVEDRGRDSASSE